ncbi:MAG TPA: zinc-binding alcohol dehydrogenase family protein [Phnomibacter sp.]|nr:zinc-binding alcohol dehydrogenase family protein [Phnomibacter sp.]
MKTLVCERPGELLYGDAKMPIRKHGETLLKIMRVGVCGTDLHAFEGTQPFFTYPRILGHELAAEVVETDREGFRQGDIVTISPYFYCGHCIACRMGKPNCCANIRVCGVHIDGGMRQYLTVPSYSLMQGHGLDADALALVEPLAIGAHGVRRAGVMPGEYVLVIGAGPIGLGTMQFASIAGGRAIAMDINEHRLQFCRQKVGIEHTVNPAKENVMEALEAITHGEMPTVMIDATGNQRAINSAFAYAAHGARYVLIGLQKGDISFSHPEFHKREMTLMSSRNATAEDLGLVMQAIAERRIDPQTYITHKVKFEAVKHEFAGWMDPASNVIKAMIEM